MITASEPAAPELRPPPAPDLESPGRGRPWLNAVLFGLTFLSATWAYLQPVETDGYFEALLVALHDPEQLVPSLWFSGSLMGILLAHEMGHWMTARRWGVDQSLPYFIPAPTLVGTLGAIILMRSQPPNRSVLLRVAVMGPYAGLLLAIPATAWGLSQSVAAPDGIPPGRPFVLGSSLLFSWLQNIFGPDAAAMDLHPVAFAGWVGLFVTSLNLIPASQLDGGHVAYAMFGPAQARLSIAVVVGMFVLGLVASLPAAAGGEANWGGVVWIFWSLFLFVIGVRHPRVADEERALTRGERAGGWLALALFVLTFIPVPVTLLSPAPGGAERPSFELPFGDDDTPPQAPEEFQL